MVAAVAVVAIAVSARCTPHSAPVAVVKPVSPSSHAATVPSFAAIAIASRAVAALAAEAVITRTIANTVHS